MGSGLWGLGGLAAWALVTTRSRPVLDCPGSATILKMTASSLRTVVQAARSKVVPFATKSRELAAQLKAKELELELARRTLEGAGHPFRESQMSPEQREAELLTQLRALCDEHEQAEQELRAALAELRQIEAKLAVDRTPTEPCARCAGTEFQMARASFERGNGPVSHDFDVVVCTGCKKSEFFLVDPDGTWMKAYGISTVRVDAQDP